MQIIKKLILLYFEIRERKFHNGTVQNDQICIVQTKILNISR